jgi:hypothetical protein
VADEAGLAREEARRGIAAMTAALARHRLPGQLEHLLARLAPRVRALLVAAPQGERRR